LVHVKDKNIDLMLILIICSVVNMDPHSHQVLLIEVYIYSLTSIHVRPII
jgi:hypothetical protein